MAGAEDLRIQSDKFIVAVDAFSAPWQRAWAPDGRNTSMLVNPVSAVSYQGVNALKLLLENHADPRWCTYEQATSQGWSVRRKEHGVTLSYVARDEGTGKSVVHSGTVFNGSQMHGIPDLEHRPSTVNLPALSRRIIEIAGVELIHDQHERQSYSIANDEIHLPPLSEYKDERAYYADLIHQMFHASGHQSRMNREMGRSFTSMAYAQEELAAEIASVFIARELGIPFKPGEHEIYAASWIKLLREDEMMLSTVTKTARQMIGYVKSLDVEHEFFHNKAQTQNRTPAPARELPREKLAAAERKARPSPGVSAERIYLFVPYEERKDASKLGARLDEKRKPKQWYIAADVDPTPFARWLDAPKPLTPDEIIKQFGDACSQMGLILDGSPEMDGVWHHTKVATSRNAKKLSGSYVLNQSGKGFIKNHDTGISTDRGWRPNGLLEIDDKYREQLALGDANREARVRELASAQGRVADKCESRWDKLPHAPDAHPYLVHKRVKSFGIRLQGDNLAIPLMDADGRIWNLQKISSVPGKTKLFEKDGRKQGLFFVFGSLDGATTVLFGEGYATCASLHMATGLPVVMCFDSGNIEAVMKGLSDRLVGVDKIICGDNDLVTFERLAQTLNGPMREKCGYPEITPADAAVAAAMWKAVDMGAAMDAAIARGVDQARWSMLPPSGLSARNKLPLSLGDDFWLVVREESGKDHFDVGRLYGEIHRDNQVLHKVMINNAGLEKALSAAAATGAKVVTPLFQDEDAYRKGWKDFNDLHVNQGLDHVRFQIGAVVDLVKGREEAAQFVREAKHNLIEVLEPAPNGRYVGRVVGHAGFHAVQDVGHNAAVAHPMNSLDRVPDAGEVARIQYLGGKGLVLAGPGKSLDKNRTR